jgi:hypothetical protein
MEDSRIQGSKGSSDPPQNRRIKMLKNYISYGSVCELETQILLAGYLLGDEGSMIQ